MITSDTDPNRKIIDGRYEQLKVLGCGAGGEVLLVRDLELEDQLLALKILYPHLAFSDASYSRFRTEARVTMQLSHPNILPTYGMGRTTEGFTYLKMEYVEGYALDTIVRERSIPLTFDFIAKVLRSVAAGLLHAHNHGIIHRDLKPANILIGLDGSIRVADFGVAYMIRAEARHTKLGHIVGTPHYMAPEALAGGLPDNRSDIYALGMVGYELVTGRPAFKGDNFWELAERIHADAPDPIAKLSPAVPDWLSTFVHRCLEKSKQLRYQDMQEALMALPPDEEDPHQRSANETPIKTRAEYPAHTGSNLTHRTQQYGRSVLSYALGTGLLLGLPLLPPWLNDHATHRYAVAVLSIERHYGQPIPNLRRVFNLDPRNRWPDVAFAGSSRQPTPTAFVEAGFEPNLHAPKLGGYAIHAAIITGDELLLEKLLAKHAGLDVLDMSGSTPLMLAIQQLRENLAITLIAAGANPSIADPSGKSALHYAARRGWTGLVTALLKKGASPHQIDNEGNTPLHEASLSENEATIRELLAYGADPLALNAAGDTPPSLSKSWPSLPYFGGS